MIKIILSVLFFIAQFLSVYSDNLLFAREFLNSNDAVTGWTFTGKQACSGQLIEANKNVYMLDSTKASSTKIFTGLPSHYRYEIRIDYIIVDTPSYSTVTFSADESTLGSYQYDGSGSPLKICGDYSTLDRFERDTCHPNCSSCNGPSSNNCTGCQIGQTLSGGICKCAGALLMQNGSCVSTCSSPYMANGSVCEFDPCQSFCDTCSAVGRQCTKCNSSKKVLAGVCVSSCPSYTTNISGVCVDMIQQYWNGYYLFKGFFENDFSSINIDSYGFTSNFVDPQGTATANWASYSDCYGIRFYGGFGIYGTGVTISKNWSIPWKHSSVLVKMLYAQVENYETNTSTNVLERLSININGELQASLINGGTDMGCGRLDQGESLGWLEANSTKTVTDGFLQLDITNNFGDPAWYEGFAFRELTVIVARCINNCSSCTDYDGCTKCDSGYYLYRAQCYFSKCPDGSYQDTSKLPKLICADCDNTCLTCNGPSSSECLTCKSPRLFKSNQCLLDCGDKFYPTATDCQPCDSTCFTCTGPLSTQCKKCSTGRYLLVSSHECLLSCPDGFFNDASQNLCSPCDSKCYTCSGPSSSQCLTCEPPKMFLHNNKCDIVCPIMYYGNKANQICEVCQSPCETCSNTATNCITCVNTYFLQFNVCQKTCNNRYFKNTVDRRCDACNVGCGECDGPNSTDCLSCDQTDGYLENKQCVSQCSIGYYGDNGTNSCQVCDPTCYACEAPGGRTNCTKCSYPRFLNMFGQCNLTCPDKYYGDTSNQICRSCHPTCLQCLDSNSTSCTKCDTGKYLSNGRCLDKCPDGTYPNDVNQTCDNCYYTCTQCTDSVPNACTACQNGRYFYNGQCLIQCPDKFYKDQMTFKCQPCDPSCYNCAGTGTDQCLSCSSGKYMKNNQCVNICNNGFYQDINTNTCEICHATCSTCFGPRPDNCNSCSGNRFLHSVNLTCVSFCPEGYYADSVTHKCISCHLNCKNCFGTAINQCSQCPDGLYLQNNQCSTSCQAGYFPMIIPNICSPCHQSCTTCTGALENECFSCSNGRYKLGTVCLEECPDNFYANNMTNQCEKCDSSCALCNGGSNNNCTKCYEKTYLYEGTCVIVCPSGYFASDLQGKCLKCFQTCDTCDKTEPTTCLSWKCSQKCPTGTFQSSITDYIQDPLNTGNNIEKKINICKNCYYGCKLCNGQDDKSCLVWDTQEAMSTESKIIYWIFVGMSIYTTFAFIFGFYRDYRCQQQEKELQKLKDEESKDQDKSDLSPSPELNNKDDSENHADFQKRTLISTNSPLRPNFRRQTTRRKRPATIILQEFNNSNNSPLITNATPQNRENSPEIKDYSPQLIRNSQFEEKQQNSVNTLQIHPSSSALQVSKINRTLSKSGSDLQQLISFQQSSSNMPSLKKISKTRTFGVYPTSTFPTLNRLESVKQQDENSKNKNIFLFYIIFNIFVRYDKYFIRPLRALIFYAKIMLLLWISSRLMPNQLIVVFSIVICLQMSISMLNNITRFTSQKIPRLVAIVFTGVIILIMFKVFWFFIPQLNLINYQQDYTWTFLFLYAFGFDFALFQILFNGLQYIYSKKLLETPPISWTQSQRILSKIFYKDVIVEWLRE